MQVADRVDVGPRGGDDEVAALEARALRGASAPHLEHEHAVALGQPDRAAHPVGDRRGRDGDPEARSDAVVRWSSARQAALLTQAVCRRDDLPIADVLDLTQYLPFLALEG